MTWLLLCLGIKLNIYFVFITQSYFGVPKNIRLDLTHYFVIKISNKRELQQFAFNHSSNTNLQDLMNLYKKNPSKPYYFFIFDTTLASDNSLPLRKNLSEIM